MSNGKMRFNPILLMEYLQDATTQLVREIDHIRSGDYNSLYKQSRSFLDAMQRTQKIPESDINGMWIRSISDVRDCYQFSRQMDGEERTTHFTVVLSHYLNICQSIRDLSARVKEWIGDCIRQLSVHPDQEGACQRILTEIDFVDKYIKEENDFMDLGKHKTLQELRGLDCLEVQPWAPVINLPPVLLTTLEELPDMIAAWFHITQILGMGIYDRFLVNTPVPTPPPTPKEEIIKQKDTNSMKGRPPWKPVSLRPNDLKRYPKFERK